MKIILYHNVLSFLQGCSWGRLIPISAKRGRGLCETGQFVPLLAPALGKAFFKLFRDLVTLAIKIRGTHFLEKDIMPAAEALFWSAELNSREDQVFISAKLCWQSANTLMPDAWGSTWNQSLNCGVFHLVVISSVNTNKTYKRQIHLSTRCQRFSLGIFIRGSNVSCSHRGPRLTGGNQDLVYCRWSFLKCIFHFPPLRSFTSVFNLYKM